MNLGSICKSDSKIRNAGNKFASNRTSLQNDNILLRGRRSASVDRSRPSVRHSAVTSRPRSSEEKKSLFQNRWSGHRSSLLNEAKGLIKDTRPLTDKAYQKRKALELFEYLQETNFPAPITVGRVMQPSKKDIENIVQHFVNFWDPNYKVKKIEDEVLKMLKELGYPFTVNKSSFVCVARHSFPHLLGVLIFLMDIARFTQHIDLNCLFNTGGSKEQAILLEYIFNCYMTNNTDDEEAASLCTELVKSTMPEDIDELQHGLENAQAALAVIQQEVEKFNDLKEKALHVDENLKKYEDYFFKMKDHKQKREVACQELREALAEKEQEAKELLEILTAKQEQYDAQGFDGKKQMSYYESQKAELVEKLQAKKELLKKLQDECWEAEMQYTKNLDKATTVCETFNLKYSNISRDAVTIVDPLKPFKNPEVKILCSNFELDLPDCRMLPTQKFFVQGSSGLKNALTKATKTIESCNLVFKNVCVKQRQTLHDVLLKKSEISVALKLTSAQETEKEKDWTSRGKMAIEELKVMDTQIGETLKIIEECRTKKLQIQPNCVELQKEIAAIEVLKREKEKMLQEYISRQQRLFAKLNLNQVTVGITA